LPLHIWARIPLSSLLPKLLTRKAAQHVDARPAKCQLPLHVFCQHAHAPFHSELTQLIEAYPDATTRLDAQGCTPLALACARAHVVSATLATLIDKGRGAASMPAGNGNFPLHSLCASPARSSKMPKAFVDVLLELLRAAPVVAFHAVDRGSGAVTPFAILTSIGQANVGGSGDVVSAYRAAVLELLPTLTPVEPVRVTLR